MKEQILAYIKQHGPTLPTTLSKEFKQESYFMSAHLSEMKTQGNIKISHIKVGGGSPLYFLSGQENQLENYSENLGEKEYKVYQLLKQKKLLKDLELVPVFRAAIRSIKDFAQPIKIKNDLFWKWYSLTKEETEKLARNVLGVKPVKKEVAKDPSAEKEIKPAPVFKEKPPEKKQDTQQKTLTPSENDFSQEIRDYFSKNNIEIIEQTIIRKTEVEYLVDLPSPVGKLRYFVKAKSKKKINDGDLSSAFIQGQTKRLPTLFLSKGDLTKKAKEMMEKEFKGMQFSTL